jgi:hypothetical protein
MENEKDTFFKRMKRGFAVLLLKARTTATEIRDAQMKKEAPKPEAKKEETKTIPAEEFAGMDMKFAPGELGL